MPEPLFYEVYDRVFGARDHRADIANVLGLGGVSPPARVLDVGCGTGNHTFACSEQGFEVTGVDVDEHMIAVALRKLGQAGAIARGRTRFFHGPVEKLSSGGFDLALSLFNVVNYVHRYADLQSLMVGIAQRIRPGASFVFDAWNGVAALRSPPGGKTTKTGDVVVRLDCETDPMALTSVLRYRIECAGGRRDEQCLVHTLWPPRMLFEAALVAGFKVLSVAPLADQSRAASQDDWKIVFHCRRAPAP